MVDIVNIVGSGSLNVEIDLYTVEKDIGSAARFDPEIYPGMYLRFTQNAPLVTVYRTGKYIVTGATSKDELFHTEECFLNLIAEMDIIESPESDWFSIQNIVCTDELNQSLNLDALAIRLGLENTEYKSEQFPGLIFRPSKFDCVVMLFATGKVVITGSSDKETADNAFREVKQRIAGLKLTK